MCRHCLEGIVDPTSLAPRLQDPCADARLLQMGSIALRIGPVVGPDYLLKGSVEPAVRLRSLLERADKSMVPGFVDEYLAAAGIGLHVWGYERLPRRGLLWKIVEDCEELDLASEAWARASMRMANLHALTVLAASELPVDEGWLQDFCKERGRAATKLYARADAYPELSRIARSNTAMLHAWLGRPEEAVRMLDELKGERMDEELAAVTLKKAMILCDSGRRDECLDVLNLIPPELQDWHARRFRSELEAGR